MQLSNLQVETVFNSIFSKPYNTILIGGFNEPEYLCAEKNQPARIQYRADYVRSALHEVSHWCLAGEKRRKINDYNYWYSADDRDLIQQQNFFQVEVRPQALEWIFSSAAGVPFKPSVDNLSLDPEMIDSMRDEFIRNLKAQTKGYLRSELETKNSLSRARLFIESLQAQSREGLLSEQEVEEALF